MDAAASPKTDVHFSLHDFRLLMEGVERNNVPDDIKAHFNACRRCRNDFAVLGTIGKLALESPEVEGIVAHGKKMAGRVGGLTGACVALGVMLAISTVMHGLEKYSWNKRNEAANRSRSALCQTYLDLRGKAAAAGVDLGVPPTNPETGAPYCPAP